MFSLYLSLFFSLSCVAAQNHKRNRKSSERIEDTVAETRIPTYRHKNTTKDLIKNTCISMSRKTQSKNSSSADNNTTITSENLKISKTNMQQPDKSKSLKSFSCRQNWVQ